LNRSRRVDIAHRSSNDPQQGESTMPNYPAFMPGYVGVPTGEQPHLHGAQLFDQIKNLLAAASDQAAGYMSQEYLDTLDRLSKKCVEYGASPQGYSGMKDRASLSNDPVERRRQLLNFSRIRPAPESPPSRRTRASSPSPQRPAGMSAARRQQLLDLTPMGRDVLSNRPVSFSGVQPPQKVGDSPVSFVGGSPLAKSPGVNFQTVGMPGYPSTPAGPGEQVGVDSTAGPVRTNLQGKQLFDAIARLLLTTQDDIDADEDLYDDDYIDQVKDFADEIEKLGGEPVQEKPLSMFSRTASGGIETDADGNPVDELGNPIVTDEAGKPRANRAKNRGQNTSAAEPTLRQAEPSRANKGPAAVMPLAPGSDPRNGAKPMSEERRRQLLSATSLGSTIYNDTLKRA
jgi:hypothetical protein